MSVSGRSRVGPNVRRCGRRRAQSQDGEERARVQSGSGPLGRARISGQAPESARLVHGPPRRRDGLRLQGRAARRSAPRTMVETRASRRGDGPETARFARCRGARRKSLHVTDSRRSAWAAGTGLHAPNASFETTLLDCRGGWLPALRLNAGVVDQNVELRKLFGDLFVKSGDRFRIGNVASEGVNFWKGRFRTVHLSLIAARDKNRVTKCRELFGEFVTDAAGAAGDQNRIARELHNFTSLSRRPTASSIDFVDASGLHPQNRAFVGLCHSPAFDRNYAGKERTHMSVARRSGWEGSDNQDENSGVAADA